MKKILIVLALVLLPGISLAADEQIRSNIVSRLLTIFVEQVNGLDYIQQQIAQATSPAQFATFKNLLNNQLAATTQQIAVMLNPSGEVEFGAIAPTTVTQPSPTPTPLPPPVDKSDICLRDYREDGNGINIIVSVLDKDGNYVKDAPISMEFLRDSDGRGLVVTETGEKIVSKTTSQTSSIEGWKKHPCQQGDVLPLQDDPRQLRPAVPKMEYVEYGTEVLDWHATFRLKPNEVKRAELYDEPHYFGARVIFRSGELTPRVETYMARPICLSGPSFERKEGWCLPW